MSIIKCGFSPVNYLYLCVYITLRNSYIENALQGTRVSRMTGEHKKFARRHGGGFTAVLAEAEPNHQNLSDSSAYHTTKIGSSDLDGRW